MALDDGNLAALPTNRIAFKDGYFIGSAPSPRAKGYVVQDQIWQAEDCSQFDASTDDNYIYEDER
jgi:hypothetical protein